MARATFRSSAVVTWWAWRPPVGQRTMAVNSGARSWVWVMARATFRSSAVVTWWAWRPPVGGRTMAVNSGARSWVWMRWVPSARTAEACPLAWVSQRRWGMGSWAMAEARAARASMIWA